jgi:hypothetical protein
MTFEKSTSELSTIMSVDIESSFDVGGRDSTIR